MPRLQAGTIQVPAGRTDGRVRVIVDAGAPAARADRRERTEQATGGTRRLTSRARSSHAYLARIDAAQRVAVAQLRRAIPEARVSWRYRILLDGSRSRCPRSEASAACSSPLVTRVYPSARYTLAADKSPSA